MISISVGAVCPRCANGRLELSNKILVCPVCEYKTIINTRRWITKYPHVPYAEGYDVFSSLTVSSTTGIQRTMFAVDIDTGLLSDAETAYAKLKELAGSVLEVYYSGSKGYHLVIPWKTWSFLGSNWTSVFKKLIQNVGISNITDSSIYKHRGMFRVPGSINSKTGKRKTLLIPAETNQIPSTWTDAVNELSSTCSNEELTVNETKEPWRILQEYTPPCIESLWLNGIPYPGSRHLTYTHLCSFYIRRGDSKEETLDFLEDYATIHETNTQSSLQNRLQAAHSIVYSAYRVGLGFSCSRGIDLGVCSSLCPLYKTQ